MKSNSMTLQRLYLLAFLCFPTLWLAAQDLSTLTSYFETQKISPTKTQEGFFYNLEKKGTGATAATGDFVVVNYIGRFLDGKTFDESRPNSPLVFQLGRKQVILGMDEGLTYFKKGSKGKLYIPAELAYGARGVGTQIPPNTDLVFEIELLNILDQAGYDDYMKKEEERAKKMYDIKITQQLAKDKDAIKKYASDKKWKVRNLPSGVSVRVKKKGKGNLITDGDEVQLKYVGQLLDGVVFDENENSDPFVFKVGSTQAIAGLDQGIRFFARGGHGHIMIPSKLAYGPRPIKEGKSFIPANSVLIFAVEVVDVESAVVKK